MDRSRMLEDLGRAVLGRAGPTLRKRLSRRGQMNLAERVAKTAWRTSPSTVAALRAELDATVGELEESRDDVLERALALRVFDGLERPSLLGMGAERIAQITVQEGLEHVDEALGKGHGVLVVTGHLGTSELLVHTLAGRGHRVGWLAPASLDDDARQGLPGDHLDLHGPMSNAAERLRRNEVVVAWIDDPVREGVVEVELGLRKARIARAPWALARETGTTVLPGVVLRMPAESMHRVKLEWPFQVARTEHADTDVRQAAERGAKWLTKWVERRPDAWLPYLVARSRGERPLFVE